MSERFSKLLDLMAALRAPNGCPWDRKQTHESLKPYLLEETYEVLETIDQPDRKRLPEELGDVLLQVLFHSQIASEAGTFTIDDVMEQLADKLVRRHPHVFPDGTDDPTPTNVEQVLAKWEDIKRAERQATGRPESVLDGVPATLPALLRAYQIQARASRVGFDWSHDQVGLDRIMGKIEEEIHELRMALYVPRSDGETAPPSRQEEIVSEFGDVLFSLVNLARFVKVNPEEALRQAINRFVQRFRYIESQATAAGKTVDDLSLEEMNRLWDAAKKQAQTEA